MNRIVQRSLIILCFFLIARLNAQNDEPTMLNPIKITNRQGQRKIHDGRSKFLGKLYPKARRGALQRLKQIEVTFILSMFLHHFTLFLSQEFRSEH